MQYSQCNYEAFRQKIFQSGKSQKSNTASSEEENLASLIFNVNSFYFSLDSSYPSASDRALKEKEAEVRPLVDQSCMTNLRVT